MKMALTYGWDVEVDRGPDWLFVRIHPPEDLLHGDESHLAERLWEMLQQGFSHRLVLELDQIHMLSTYLVGQLVLLHKRIGAHGGTMRICGLSPRCAEVLRIHRLADRLYPYENRTEAVMGVRPNKPR